MERRSGETKSLLSSAQATEVLSSLWNDISTELHDNAASGLSADGDIKVYLRVRPMEENHNKKAQYVRLLKTTVIVERYVEPGMTK
jgi:hypothetical protein